MEEFTEHTELENKIITVSDIWSAQFDTGEKLATVSIPYKELDKLAKMFYEFCLDNKIDATLEIKDKE